MIYAPAALASLKDILRWTLSEFGEARAERYTAQLVHRLESLAAGHPPHPRPCSTLSCTVGHESHLRYFREGRHYLILRETDETLELVEVFHERMNVDAWLRALSR
ncbi:type II toxin-antitoxin system RelE/ParE family toxin [Halomonas sp. DP5N14-9]|uniref:type II toxin-antitoxin system RelE/ParE family toxin n=1 Tax=Halomonas sp. DP5N14-9 TaxID=2859075 RepID=UPI001C99A1A6|nr:type II toxin-antitoxin system RelE/ParE family toxin [Halomonas sp. DP5N14-9]